MCSLWSMPPTTRSMASLGRTYIFIPPSATATAIAMKIINVRKNMALDLDIHDLFHNQVADHLQRDGAAHHDVAGIVGEEKLDVIRIGVEHQHRHRDRDTAQRRGRHLAVGADRPDPAAQLEALAD